MIELLAARLHYWVFIVLLLLGLHAMLAQRNLARKLIGMTVFQTAIMLFYISLAAKWGAGVPISGTGGVEEIDRIHNPLPHVLMLTAIVVSVSTAGVGMAMLMTIYSRFGSLEEDEIMERIT